MKKILTRGNAAWLLLSAILTGGEPDQVAPDMSSAPESMTPAERDAAMDKVNQVWGALNSGSLENDNQALAAYIGTQPEFADAGIAADGTVWARFIDGFPVQFITKTVPPGSVLPASALKVSGAIPQGDKALLIDVDLLAEGSLATIEPALQKKGYSTGRLQGSVEDFMSIRNVGVLFISSHGGTLMTKAGRPSYGIMTNEKCVTFDPLSAHANTLKTMYRSGVLAMAGVRVRDTNGVQISLPGTFWSITEQFVHENWSFTGNSLVVLDACELFLDSRPTLTQGHAVYQDFRAALKWAGATSLLGWDGQVSPGFASKAMQLFFDRVLGANAYQPETPPQRPFSYKQVYDWMSANNKHVDQSFPNAKLMLEENGTTLGQLVPSIVHAVVSHPAQNAQYGGEWILELAGNFFGPDAGTVTVGNTQLATVYSWTEGIIIAKLPASMTGPGSSGDIVVEVRGHKSNAVPLTQWTGTVTQVQTGMVSGGGKVEFSCPVRATADVHFSRGNLAVTPQLIAVTSVEVPTACNYTFSGSWSVGSYDYVLSGSGTYSLPTIVNADIWGTLLMTSPVSALPIDLTTNFFPSMNPSGTLKKTYHYSNGSTEVTTSTVSVTWSLAPTLGTNRVTLGADYKLTGTLNCKDLTNNSSATCTETWNAAPLGLTAPKADTQS
jgi:hypothetical protein